jgi:hypothetical protein
VFRLAFNLVERFPSSIGSRAYMQIHRISRKAGISALLLRYPMRCCRSDSPNSTGIDLCTEHVMAMQHSHISKTGRSSRERSRSD